MMKLAQISMCAACLLAMISAVAAAETCITQSQMQPADRDALAETARSLALKVQANDQPGVQGGTIAEYAANFGGIANAMAAASPKMKGDTAAVDQVYVLDASMNKLNPDGSAPDAEFTCTLNKSQADAEFSIGGLPPGRYGFALVQFEGIAPWNVSMLLRQDAGTWKLAGLYPKSTIAAGHDGLWYWKQARTMAANKQAWSAYLYYQQAQQLLKPVGFVSSTHLENLREESSAALPPALTNGINPDEPLVVKGADGTDYRFTAIVPDDSLNKEKLDIAAHMQVAALSDPASMRKRNMDAMAALVNAHPEWRESFHGIWVFSEVQGQAPVANEAAMSEIH